MELRITKEIEQIRETVVHMATLTEESVRDSINAFFNSDIILARSVISRDSAINTLEIDIDKHVFETLALKAPVATDLRYLFSTQKINKDLERIADHAVNIAEATIRCLQFGQPPIDSDIRDMAAYTREMLGEAISSFVLADTKRALKVLEQDEKVDSLNKTITHEVINMVKTNSTSVEAALELLSVSKNLERIADLSTNIAEDVIFHARAQDVKHHHHSAEELK